MGVIDVCPTAAWLVDNRRIMAAFTQPFLNGDQRLLVRRYRPPSFWSDPTQWFGVFAPFSWTLWLATFLICVGGGLLLVLVEGPDCVVEERRTSNGFIGRRSTSPSSWKSERFSVLEQNEEEDGAPPCTPAASGARQSPAGSSWIEDTNRRHEKPAPRCPTSNAQRESAIKTAFFAACTSVYLSLYGLLVLDVPHKCLTFKGRTVKYLLASIIF
eukprot:g15594.t1